MIEGRERRRFPRVAAAMDVTVVVGGKKLTGKTLDISREGFAFHLANPLPLNERFHFELSHDEVRDGPLQVEGRVVHVHSKSGDAMIAIGVDIEDVLEGSETALSSFFELIDRRLA